MNRVKVRIVEFEPLFELQVRQLISAVYREFGYGPNLDPVGDADLFAIPETYVGRSRFWVAVREDKAVGTGAIRERESGVAEVKRMYVLPPYRGQGVGLALLQQGVDFARTQSYQRLRLETFARLNQAIRLYERYGFRQAGSVGDRIVYELFLTAAISVAMPSGDASDATP
jgi:GNAT superfamily N-acetyltransferase